MFPLSPSFPEFLLLSITSYGMEYQFGSAVLLMFPPNLLPSPASLLCVFWGWRDRKSWCCASIAQPRPKHWCAIRSASVANTKHSSIWAAMKKKLTPPQALPVKLQITTPYSLSCRCIPKHDESCSHDSFKTSKAALHTMLFFFSLGFCSVVYCIGLHWHTPLYKPRLHLQARTLWSRPSNVFCISFPHVNMQTHLNCL